MEIQKPKNFKLISGLPKWFPMSVEYAIKQYVRSTDNIERNEIFNNKIHNPLEILIDNVLEKYELPGIDYANVKSDMLCFLVLKLDKYSPDSETPALRFLITICRHYLKMKIMEYKRYHIWI